LRNVSGGRRKVLQQFVCNSQGRFLVVGPEAAEIQNTITFEDLAVKLTQLLRESHRSPQQLGDQIGFRIDEVQGTGEALWGYTVEALYLICKSVHIDWVKALPSRSTVRRPG
jgi:hypothetical protein